MSESSPSEASPASTEDTPLLVQCWGPAIVRAQPSQLARSFPLSFGPALACMALGTFLACVSHWAWALAAIAAGLWIGRRVEVLQAPFLIRPLHPALVRDAERCEPLVLLEFAAQHGELFASVVRISDTGSARWLRRYRTGQELTVAFVQHDAGTWRAMRVEAATRDTATLRAAHASIPDQARRLLEAANARLDNSSAAPERIALGPGAIADDLAGAKQAADLNPASAAESATPRRDTAQQPLPEREPSAAAAYRAFAGLPERGEAPFPPEVAAHVAAASRHQRRLAAVTLLFAIAGPLCLALQLSDPSRPVFSGVLGVSGVLGSLFSAPLLWGVFDRWRLARSYARDAAAGTLVLFAGRIALHEAAYGDPQQAWLMDRRLFEPDLEREQSVGVGRTTRRVWMVNGRPVRDLLIAHLARLAPVPEDAADLPLPPTNELAVPDGWRLKRRLLTSEERIELERHVTRMRRIGFGKAALLLTLLLLAGFFAWAGEVPWPRAYPYLILALVGWFGLLFDTLYRQRAAAALERDRADGHCLVLLPGYAESLAHPERRSEVLPASRKLWAHMGRPAPWRGALY